MISSLIKNQSVNYSAAEIVIRHWQYMFNSYGQTAASGKCPRACTRIELINILKELERHDLVELIESVEA